MKKPFKSTQYSWMTGGFQNRYAPGVFQPLKNLRIRSSIYLQSLVCFLCVIGLLWIIEFIDTNYYNLSRYGVRAGNWRWSIGIFLGPFFHNDWGHLTRNSVALLILGPMVILHGKRKFASATFLSIVFAGLVIMVLGEKGSVHSGASGVVYGYAAFLAGLGIFERKPLSIITALVTLAVYGYANFMHGMIPSAELEARNISWQGHLGGALGGFIASYCVSRKRRY